MSYSFPRCDPIECGIAGDTFEIDYDGLGRDRACRVVVAEALYVSFDTIYLDAFCCTRGETRTFALDRIHRVRELSQSGVYDSVQEWLASYGILTELELFHDRWIYRFIGVNGAQSSDGS